MRRRARLAALLVAVVGAGLAAVGPSVATAQAAAPLGVVRTVAAGILEPAGITTGPDGNLWFASSGNDSIGRMTPSGEVTTFTGAGFDGPQQITAGVDGNLWFTTKDRTIGRITPAGVIDTFDPGSSYPRGYGGITAGPDGNVWFTSPGSSSVGRITPAGVVIPFSNPSIRSPSRIAAGPDGSMWFTDPGDDSVRRLTPDGVLSTFRLGEGLSNPFAIAAGPDGNIWFTNYRAVNRITPDGAISTFTPPARESVTYHPREIVAGPDGNLWVTFDNGSIGRVTTAGEIAVVNNVGPTRGITAGPDGNLWTTTGAPSADVWEAGAIARVTPAGQATLIPSHGISHPLGITAGPDGNLWFANSTTDTIGRITPAGQVSTFSHPDLKQPTTLAAGPDGNIWFGGGSRGRVTPAGEVTVLMPSPSGFMDEMAPGSDGNMWYTVRFKNLISRVTPAGTIAYFGHDQIHTLTDITAGPDGNAWFASSGNGRIGRITPSGEITMLPPLGGGRSPHHLTTGADGNLWFTDVGTNSIGRMTPAGVTSTFVSEHIRTPQSITAAPDGSVWFMNRSYDDFSTHHAWISRLTPAGAVTRYDIPNRFEPTGSIAAGADGNMWFTTDDLHGIGTVGTGLPGAPGGVSVGVAGGTATVSWSAPSTDGGSPVLGYTVTATPGGQRCTWLAGPLSCTLTGLPVGAPITFSVVATNVNGPGPAAAVSHGVPPKPTGVPFHALTPARIYDSRPNGPDVFPYAPWAPGERRDVKVAGPGVGGVPSAADAVVLNVTVTGTTAAGWLTVWPAGQARPTASSLNWSSGQTVANAVTVKVGAGGNVSVHNPIGKAHVIIDVVGWYGIDPGSGYTPLTPARILDSRLAPGGTPWTPGQTRDTKVLGVGGVQPEADTVVVNVTVTGTTAAGYLTIWPAGQPRPIASSLNWAPGQTVANAVTVKASAGGAISIFNPLGSTHVILDIVGSFTPGSGHLFHPQAPVRIQDSRPPGPKVGPYGTAWSPATARDVQVGGAGGVPVGAAAALLNVTATDTTATSYLTIAPTGTAPLASSLNWVAGQTVPNSVPAKLSPDGAITIRNFAGNAHVIADVAGWYG